MSSTVPADPSHKVRISILGCGGTISTGFSGTGLSHRFAATDLVAGMTQRLENVALTGRDVMQVSSRNMTPRDMLALASSIEAEAAAGADGVVVLHGTDTLEETAYFLGLVLEVAIPVVVTGAMRAADAPGADGPGNICAAVVAASAGGLRGCGPVVVLADSVHDPAHVTKAHTSSVDAFASPGHGPIGQIVEDRLWLDRAPSCHRLGRPEGIQQTVEALWIVAGARGELVRATAQYADGLVLAGTGGGHVPASVSPAVLEAAARMPVVLSTRCAAGRVLEGTYTGPGSEQQLLASGLISAGDLGPLKARLRLMVALELGLDPKAVFAGV
ncbi:asparaginase [Nocardioides terrisoli]|uniref:asparaginase n=1 Tax=Nocardioides terrisoli TaxID=3388267 RepID=UPI00287BC295|nr:asparaginase [Nocardioides marmorisolisilvae]